MNLKQPYNIVIFELILLSFVTAARHSFDEESLANYCAINCSTRRHTLCLGYQNALGVACDNEKIMNGDIKHLLISGHNGLRNRIASHMNVANMVHITWNPMLEKMALYYMDICTPFINDECTEFEQVIRIENYVQETPTNVSMLSYIAQNRFCLQSEFYPIDFVEETMRHWYFEKDRMTQPTFRKDGMKKTTYGVLHEETNFTHLAYPLTTHFGCGISKYEKFYCIICNYYPFHRLPNHTILFRSGTPTSQCPAVHPLRHDVFHRLCTGGLDDCAAHLIYLPGIVVTVVALLQLLL